MGIDLDALSLYESEYLSDGLISPADLNNSSDSDSGSGSSTSQHHH